MEEVAPASRFPIVGVGASAGGLAALRAFFDGVPEKCGMAFVVVVHLDPNHKSHMAELLQRHTTMRVRQVSRAMKVEPDQVYIIPPDKDLTLLDGHFRLSARALPNRSRAPIDGFFRTLAETHTTDAIGIVLSGTGSDGTLGIGWIKEKGGITMAQIPHEAEYPSMPESAIATGHVDVVLPVGQLGMETLRLCSGDSEEAATAGTTEFNEEEKSTIGEILALVRSKTQHDFGGYKRSTIDRRVKRRAQFARAANLPDYLRLINENATELGALYDDLLISVTSFFRDPESFKTLEREVIPRLFANKKSPDTVRVWVTGCSTGEEAYSICILLAEYAEGLTDRPYIHVFATDVHERGFSIARDGFYPESIVSDVSPERLERFFTREPGGYRIKKVIRESVVFAVHNLLRDPPFLRIDLVSCRNLLIYLQRDAQHRVLRLFHFALRPGASMFLGTSESVEDVAKLFTVVDKKHRIFRSIEMPQTQVSPLLGVDGAAAPKARSGGGDREDVVPFPAAHRRLLEAFAPPTLLVNTEGTIVHLSEAVGKYLQIGSGKPTKKLIDMLPASTRAKVRKLLTTVFATGQRSEVHGLTMRASGRKRLVNLIARPLRGTNATEAFVMVVFDETHADTRPAIVSAKAARGEKEASTTRELERELAEAKFQLGVTIEEHESSAEELKASNEELQSINEEQRATEEELEASKEELQSINEELQTINQEYRTKNEQLSELNSDLSNLIDSTEIATIFLDRNLRIRRYTPAVNVVFNLLPSDAGRPLADVTHRLEYANFLDDAREVMRTLMRFEREVLSQDRRWYIVRISPYRSLDDRIDGVVVTFIDTTDRKLAAVDREKLLDEVQSASVAKSNFIGVMSHELRTPLNAILGYADILAAGAVGPMSDEQTRHLDRIKASATHLAHMIDDSLQSVRIEAGITALDLESVDIAAIVREVGLLTEPLVTAKGLDFRINAEDGPPVVTDPTRVRQILFNLLGNAVRYTDAGTVTLTSKVTDHGATISVEDTGIGISAENLDRIFERFWQVDQSKTRLRGGTGLGLMVSRSLAQLMGGELVVTSEFGKGSRFVVRLPLAKASNSE